MSQQTDAAPVFSDSSRIHGDPTVPGDLGRLTDHLASVSKLRLLKCLT